MNLNLDFRIEMGGAWETARGFIVEQFDRILAGLSPLNPLTLLTYTPSSVLVTDASGNPQFGKVLPTGIAFGATSTNVTRVNGSQILPAAYNTQAVSYPTANKNQLAHSFFINTNVDIPGSSSQGVEAYNYYNSTGTTPIVMGLVGNTEHGGTGTVTNMRSVQNGHIISNTGGGGDAVSYFASLAGRAFGGTGTFTNGIALSVAAMGAGYTNHYAVYSADTTAGIFLTSDTAVKSTTNTWQVSSDRRLKRDVQPFTDGLNVVERLEPVTYAYNGVGDTIDGAQGIGVIAQDAQPIAPYIIKSRNAQDGETYLTSDSGPLTFVLLNAVKELSARVATLEAKAAA